MYKLTKNEKQQSLKMENKNLSWRVSFVNWIKICSSNALF